MYLNNIMMWVAVYLIRHHFLARRYEKVLNGIRLVVSNPGAAFIYRNVMRIVALNKTQDPQWRVEIEWLINSDAIEQVAEKDRVYLMQYLNKTLGEEIFENIENIEINSDTISKKMVSFFH